MVGVGAADIRGYFSGSGINTSTGVITNTTYSASDFAITGLSGYAAGDYLNSEVTYAELNGTKPPTNAEANPSVATVRGYFSGSGINTSTGVITDTNTTYSASDFNITGLAGYTAAAYANANLGWTVVSVTVGEVNTTWTHNGTAYSPTATTQTVTMAITHPSFRTSSVVGTWTRTNKTISGFSLGSGSGASQDNNWAFGDVNSDAGSQDNAFGSATADHGIKTIYVQHTDSNTILEIFAQVLNTNFSIKCLTPTMLPENLQIGDEVDSPEGKTKVTDIIRKQREGYYILEDELERTNDHPIEIIYVETEMNY